MMFLSCSAQPNPPPVLNVEDERIIAMATTVNLKRMGCKVIGTAPSGQEAIDTVAEHRPDVVLMDIMLEGGMDGIEAAHRIREANPDLPIIYCTAYTDTGTRHRAAQTAPRAFLGKPLDYRALKDIIDDLE